MTSKVIIKLEFDLFVAGIRLLASPLKLISFIIIITFLMEPKKLTFFQVFQLPDVRYLCL